MSDKKEVLRDLGLLWLRLLMGAGIAYHGYGKVFGGHMPEFAHGVGNLGFPYPLVFAWAAALSEFAGGILIALGLLTRLAALSVLITMAVAAFMALGEDPFQAKELALLFGVVAGALILTGAGRISFDALIWK